METELEKEKAWNDLVEKCMARERAREQEDKMKVKVTYGTHEFWGILFDFIMVLLTGGLWFLWIIIRYLRSH